MKHDTRKCQHCGSKYHYVIHGGYPSQHNDSRFCPSCMVVCLDALKNVPKKFHHVHVDASDEITREELLNCEHVAKQKARNKGNIYITRMQLGHFYNDDSNNSRMITTKNGTEYWLSEFENFNEYTISKMVYVSVSDKIDTTLKTLINPNKSSEKPTPMKVEGFKAMTGPVGLAYAMKYSKGTLDKTPNLS